MKWSEFNLSRKISTSQIMKVTEDNTSPEATFTKMKARGPAAEHLNRKSRAKKANSSSFDNEETPQETKLFRFSAQITATSNHFSNFHAFSATLTSQSTSMYWNVEHFSTKQCSHMPPNLSKTMFV